MKLSLKLLPAIAVLLLLTSTPALAIDAKILIDRYAKFAGDQGQAFEYESIEGSGDTFTVVSPSWTIPQVPPIKSDRAVFSGVEEATDGSVVVGSIEIGALRAGSGDISVTIDGATMKNLQIPKAGETEPLRQILYYQSFKTGKTVVMRNGAEVASMGSADIALSPYSQTEPITMSMNMNDIAFDLSAVPDPKFQSALSDLGYESAFTGRIKMDGTWSMPTGVMEIGTYDMIVDKVGTFSFPFVITGYTAENIVEMQQLSKSMQGETDQAELDKISMAMFAKLAVKSGTIRFTDDSITKRALDFAGKQMGQPPEQLAAGAPFMVGAAMAQLNMPELTQQISRAVGQYLQNPGNIAVSVNPADPVTFQEMAATGQANPKALVEKLRLEVSAN